jgi:TonB family protein
MRRRELAAALLLSSGLVGNLAAQATTPPPCLSASEQPAVQAPRPEGAPVLDAFSRIDVAPVLQNRDEMAAALEREYPAANRAAGVGGQTYLWILVDLDGVPRGGQVNISSGCQELDDAALRAAEGMRFSPAVDEGRPTPIWIPIAINFDPATSGGGDAPDGTAAAREITPDPSFTPFDVAPQVQNRGEVAAAIRLEYPRALRDAVVSGRTIVWMQVDAAGVVRDVRINESSGRRELDQAALRIARVFRFSPAMSGGEPVPVWITIPIQF